MASRKATRRRVVLVMVFSCSSLLVFFLIIASTLLLLDVAAQVHPVDESPQRVNNEFPVEFLITRPRFPVNTHHGVIDGGETSQRNIDSYLPMLTEQWNLYPGTLLKMPPLGEQR